MKILAIARGEEFSPNLVDNDAKILAEAADNLRLQGHEVTVISERELTGVERVDAIIQMCRSERSVSLLKQMEGQGIRIINSPQGVDNCRREPLVRCFEQAGVASPRSLILESSEPLPADVPLPCWVKRADGQTMQKADVSFCRSRADVEAALRAFDSRGIRRAVICQHLDGDLIKFYGVEGTDFFYWFYPLEHGHSKFGYEEINGHSAGIAFDEGRLRQICSEASRAVNVSVYGGDAIVSPDGTIKIIDFNDWPSFSPCREAAGKAISQLL
ncbi:MAG: hypothetical protein HDR75_07335 [Bacteroides sp.]|nr:hypothetical protein [Bacteroides sp.]